MSALYNFSRDKALCILTEFNILKRLYIQVYSFSIIIQANLLQLKRLVGIFGKSQSMHKKVVTILFRIVKYLNACSGKEYFRIFFVSERRFTVSL